MTRRIIVSAGQSGAGKTTIVLGLIRALSRRGLSVSSAKIGPDYIDPMYHRAAGGEGYTLDRFLMEETYLRARLKMMEEKDIAILEGAMGYYDGIGTTSEGSCAEMSVLTNTPSILIFSGKGKGISLAAEIKGFLGFEKHRIEGIILNRTKPSLFSYYKKIVEKYVGLPLLGCIPEAWESFPSQKLGLRLPEEVDHLFNSIEGMADTVEKYVDIEKLLEIAKTTPFEDSECDEEKIEKTKVAIARDAIFSFYYRDVLEDFEARGVEWVPFSPLEETIPLGVSGVYFGGGYPERRAADLGKNRKLAEDLKRFISGGGVLIAEGGGFISLLDSIDGTPLLGVFRGDATMTDRLQHFGYHRMIAKKTGLLLEAGEEVFVHEFHYALVSKEGEDFTMQKPYREKVRSSSRHTKTVYAGCPHLHLSGKKRLRKRVLSALEEAVPWRG